MFNLFIQYHDVESLTELTEIYLAAHEAHKKVKTLVERLKSSRGCRIGNPSTRDLDEPRTRERERAYEVDAIRLKNANTALFQSLGALKTRADEIDKMLKAPKNPWRNYAATLAGAQNNVVCAYDLYNEAACTYYDTAQTQLESFGSHIAIARTFADYGVCNTDVREFTVHYDGSSIPIQPTTPPYMTLEEARLELWQFVHSFDYGINANVFNIRTGENHEDQRTSIQAVERSQHFKLRGRY